MTHRFESVDHVREGLAEVEWSAKPPAFETIAAALDDAGYAVEELR